MAILSILVGLFGCKESPNKTPKYKSGDINSISISCGHIDQYYCYSFVLSKSEGKWIFSAECYLNNEVGASSGLKIQSCTVTTSDVDKLLEIIDKQNVISSMEKYKVSKVKLFVRDETVYHTAMSFANGDNLQVDTLICKDIESYFYNLADKYKGFN